MKISCMAEWGIKLWKPMQGRVLRVLEQVDPEPGSNLILHIDSRLQQVGEKAMAGRRGAVAAIEPSTGRILAMVSTPSFNPNLFVTGIDYKKATPELRDSPDIPLYNRAIRGSYLLDQPSNQW